MLARLTSLPGIGAGLALALLRRPNNTVITTHRNASSIVNEGLNGLHPASGSKWIVQYYAPDVNPESEAERMITELTSRHEITKIDVLIANLGAGTEFRSTLDTTPDSILNHFNTNALGPVVLFRKLHPLLNASENPKFILISSSLGSIGEMEGGIPSLAYGMSKAAANYFVRKVHFEHQNITSLAIHPGWVKTENGQNFADAIGVAEPPATVEQSVEGILVQVS